MILLVSPPVQLIAVAELIVTAEGPVIIKSDPLGAMELHCKGEVKLSVMDWGRQGGGVIVPMGTGGCADSVKPAVPPAFTILPQLPIKVFPSLPVAIVIV